MSDIVQVDRSNFYDAIEEASIPVVVEFFTDWCETCQELEPVVEELADEYEETIRVLTVDLDEEGRLANEFNVANVPTFLAFFRGNSLKRKSGDLTANEVESIFEYLTQLPRVAA